MTSRSVVRHVDDIRYYSLRYLSVDRLHSHSSLWHTQEREDDNSESFQNTGTHLEEELQHTLSLSLSLRSSFSSSMAISNIPSNMTAPPQSPGGNQSLAGSLGSPPRRSNATSSSSSSSAFKPLPPLLTGRTEAGICTAILHGRSPVLVVAGGRTTTTTTSRQNNNNGHETTMMISRRVELLEWSIQRRWWRLPDLTTPRYGFAMVGIGAQLCCIGGLGNPASTAPYASMETLTLGQDDAQWQVVTTTTATARDQQSSLQTPRMYPAAVTYSDGGSSKILVVGGRDASLQELDTCEVYSLETQRWNHHHSHDEQPIMPMDSPRFACGLVYVPSIHVVVAVGGYNGSHWTTSCESYDIVENCWKNDIPPMLRPVQFVSATLLSSGSQGQDYIVVRGVPVDGDDADEDHHEGAGGNVAVLQCYNILMEEWMMLPPTSSLVGAAMTSMDQTRIVTVGGGGAAAAASKDCRFWMPNLTKLFREDNHLDASLKLDEVTMSGSVAASAMDESTVHPWLYGPSGSASVAASVARSVAASTTTTTTNRRKVEDEPLLDNFGVQVRFTGYIHGESGRPQGKGRMTWTVTGDRYEGRFEQGGKSFIVKHP